MVLRARYTHGPGIDEPLARADVASGQTVYYHADGQGSITEVTDGTGAVVQRYSYEAFGTMLASPGIVSQSYTFTGRELDAETGLYYYRARYYDSNLGRFLTVDPIIDPGLLSLSPAVFSVRRLPGVNPLKHHLYAYVEMNPATFIDPLGLASDCPKPSPECPGGIWSGAGFDTGLQLGSLGIRRSGVTVRCWSNPGVTADVDTTCDILGGGLSADFSAVGLYCFGAQSKDRLSGSSEGFVGGGGFGVVSGGGGLTSSKTGPTCISISTGLGAGLSGGIARCRTTVY